MFFEGAHHYAVMARLFSKLTAVFSVQDVSLIRVGDMLGLC